MSRTKSYIMMESKEINLSFGSNALNNLFFNSAGIFENLTDKNTDQQIPNDVFSFAGFDSPEWVMETDNEKLIDMDVPYINETYSLDDLLDAEALMSPACSNISSEFMETPLSSPLSSSDETSCDLDELLLVAAPDAILGSNAISDVPPCPLFEHTYAASYLPEVDFKELSRADIDAGVSSGEESITKDSQDLLMQLLNGQFDIVNESLKVDAIVPSTVDISAVAEPTKSLSCKNILRESKELNTPNSKRFLPYKKKTPQQRQRKKMQNRNAALKYRSRKKDEMQDMFSEADELEGKNRELKGKVDGLKKEIDYLKNLMLDVIKVRLSKNNTSLDEVLSNTLMSIS